LEKISKSQLSQIVKLKQKKYRSLFNTYIISGLNTVKTALESPTIKVSNILVQDDRIHILEEMKGNVKSIKSDIILRLSSREFKQLSDEQQPQGIALIAEKPKGLMEKKLPTDQILLYFDQINDPGNLGTILRTAAWFGIKTILTSQNSADTFQPKVVRSSVGLIAHLNIMQQVDSERLSQIKKTGDYTVIATTKKSVDSLEHYSFENDKKLIIVFGSEAHGISRDIINVTDKELTIPCYGNGESLNLATSVAIFLYQIRQSIAL